MNSPYLSFPELPGGYVWTYDGIGKRLAKTPNDSQDVDITVDKPGPIDLILRGWVHARYPHPPEARERNDERHTFCMPVDSIQDGIDLLAARCWLGLTGVPDV